MAKVFGETCFRIFFNSSHKQALGFGHCMHLPRVKLSKAILCPHIPVSDCNVSYLSVCDLGSVDYFFPS